MTSTPAKSLKSIDDIKTSGGIRKSLLTPCRRVGLSRVVKTPASSEKGVNSLESSIVCKTPINSNSGSICNSVITTSKERKKVFEVKSQKKVVDSVKKPKKTISKCLLPDAQSAAEQIASPKLILHSPQIKTNDFSEQKRKRTVEDTDTSNDVTNNKQNKSAKNAERKPQRSIKKCLLPDLGRNNGSSEDGTISSELFSDSSQAESGDSHKQSKCSIEEKENTERPNSPEFYGFDHKDRNPKKPRNICTLDKQVKAVLNTADLTNLSDAEDDFQPVSKIRTVISLSSSSESSVNSTSKEITADKESVNQINNGSHRVNEKPKVSFRKRLSMKKSKCSDKSDSDEFSPSPVSSQDHSQQFKNQVTTLTELPLLYETTEVKDQNTLVENDFDYEVTEEMLRQIESSIREKEEKLDALRRAEVYSKKHKVDELNKLTLKWKTGCIQALEDIQELLQKNNDKKMDMMTLLRTLKVPENILKCNSENGDLV